MTLLTVHVWAMICHTEILTYRDVRAREGLGPSTSSIPPWFVTTGCAGIVGVEYALEKVRHQDLLSGPYHLLFRDIHVPHFLR
eukprot:2511013-Amphidinium_carterae.1